MQYICKLDKEKFKLITEQIISEEVILTDNQIEHIKTRHPNNYEKYFNYMKEIIMIPYYIMRDKKSDTGFLLKRFQNGNLFFLLILRLHTKKDPKNYKNSIITFLKINSKKYIQYLRNKEIVWKNIDIYD